jgi:hypothetical protein
LRRGLLARTFLGFTGYLRGYLRRFGVSAEAF